jgi:tetratricopeptide (TPR) repeat protein
MKTEIKEILDYMEGGEEILRLREQVKNLDAQDSTALQNVIDSLHVLVDQVNAEDQEQLGYYDLFLGCACHEQEDYRKATVHLKRALPKLRGSKNNKAVAHWLLSVNYSSSKEHDKARKELIKAEKLSKARINAIQEKIDLKIKDMFNDPIFDEVPPEPKKQVLQSAMQI